MSIDADLTDLSPRLMAMDGHTAGADELELLRGEIDRVDAALVELLGHRVVLTERVGRHKATQAITATDPARECRQFRRPRPGLSRWESSLSSWTWCSPRSSTTSCGVTA
jgi:hypothetical protein